MSNSDSTSSQASAPASTSDWEDDDKTHHPTNQTSDFYLDTHFNPIWTDGPNVFSYTPNGTVLRPEMYAQKPWPGQGPVSAYATPRISRDPKWWKNVAITEHDDAEFVARAERQLARIRAVEEQEQLMYNAYYGHPQRYAREQGMEGPYGAHPQAYRYPAPPPKTQ